MNIIALNSPERGKVRSACATGTSRAKHPPAAKNRWRHLKLSPFLACWCLALCSEREAVGQAYSLDWFTIDGGGGTSTGGVYSVSGTIGQPDTGHMFGGNFTLEGGFWSFLAVVTPGAPSLRIERTTTNTVVLSWLTEPAGFSLQQTTNLSSSIWGAVTNAPVVVGGENQVILSTHGSGRRLFRLIK